MAASSLFKEMRGIKGVMRPQLIVNFLCQASQMSEDIELVGNVRRGETQEEQGRKRASDVPEHLSPLCCLMSRVWFELLF